MQKETIKIEFSYAQVQMLLGALYESQKAGLIAPEDYRLFAETQSVVENAENDYFINQVDFAINNSI